jgi:hypothetical protein
MSARGKSAHRTKLAISGARLPLALPRLTDTEHGASRAAQPVSADGEQPATGCRCSARCARPASAWARSGAPRVWGLMSATLLQAPPTAPSSSGRRDTAHHCCLACAILYPGSKGLLGLLIELGISTQANPE